MARRRGKTYDRRDGYARWADVPEVFRRRIERRIEAFRQHQLGQSDFGTLDLSACGLDPATAIATVHHQLRPLNGIKLLKLNHNRIEDAGALAVAQWISGLNGLEVDNCGIRRSAVPQLVGHLRASSPSLTELRIAKNMLGDVAVQQIAAGVSGLNKLFIHGTGLTETGVGRLVECLRRSSPSLCKLSIGENRIGDDGVRRIVDEHRGLELLAINDVGLTTSGAADIVDRLAAGSPKLIDLWISKNRLGDAVVRHVAERLKGLTDLALDSTGLTDAAAVEVVDRLAEHSPRLASFSIGGNRIGDAGVSQVANQLTGLTTLWIDSTGLTAAAAVEVVDRLAERSPGLAEFSIAGNRIGDAGVRRLAERLTGLTKLRIDNAGLTEAAAVAVTDLLADWSPGLVDVDIGRNQIGDAGVRRVAERLSGLTKLWIDETGLTEAAAVQVVDQLAEQSPGLAEFSVTGNRVGDAGLRRVAERLTGLTKLWIANTGLTEAAAFGVVNLLAERSPGLAGFSIAGNRIGDAGVRRVAEQLTGLTQLAIDNTGLTEAAAVEVVDRLAERSPALAELSAFKNAIGDAGLLQIAERLKGLTTLYLAETELTSSAAVDFADRVTQSSPRLERLVLEGNVIGDAGVLRLAKALKGLRLLAIGNTGLTEAAAVDIVDSLFESSPQLSELRLQGNDLGDAGANRIGETLKSLEVLVISRCSIQHAEIVIALVRNLSRLKEIHVGGNPLTFRHPSGERVTVPDEVLNETDPQRLQARLLEYRPGSGARRKPIHAVRVAVVGRREVGKSHLWDLLYSGNAQAVRRKPEKTRSWMLRTLTLEGVGPHGTPVDVRYFDHGGDLELHGGHRTFFGDRRCIYLIVVNASQSRTESLLDYWLQIVRCYGMYPDERKGIVRSAPTVVVLSWRDQGVHADFAPATVTEETLSRGKPEDADEQKDDADEAPRIDVRLARDYWDPIGDRGTGARSKAAQQQLKGLDHNDRFEVVRGAIAEAIGHLHQDLNAAYPEEYERVLKACEVESGLLSRGPTTVKDIRKAFYDETQDLKDLDDDVGLDLLRNLGVVICPSRDNVLAEQFRSSAGVLGVKNLRIARESREETRARTELGDAVFGVTWLRDVLYAVVNERAESSLRTERNGLITHDDMRRQLQAMTGGDAETARRTLEFLIAQRLVFNYHAGDGVARYIIVDRLPETRLGESLVRMHTAIFKDATRYVARLRLLLATHLPQFIGHAYAMLRGTVDLDPEVRRDRVVVRRGSAEVLLTVDLNDGTVAAMVKGDDGDDKRKLLNRIEQAFETVTGEEIAFKSLAGEAKPQPAPERKATVGQTSAPSRGPAQIAVSDQAKELLQFIRDENAAGRYPKAPEMCRHLLLEDRKVQTLRTELKQAGFVGEGTDARPTATKQGWRILEAGLKYLGS